MRERLHDLRLLYLAHKVEETFEGLEKAMDRHLPEDLREVLRPLFEGGPAHAELETSLDRLNHELEAQQERLSVEDLLMALRDLEETAQEFYLRHAPELSDPVLGQLFRRLAAEEARHLQAVARALQLAAASGRAPGRAADAGGARTRPGASEGAAGGPLGTDRGSGAGGRT